MCQDPGSSITGYRYGIGSAPGAVDIVSWTNTTATQVTRSGLGLTAGHQYWLLVQCHNPSGLWSNRRAAPFVSGLDLYKVFLPFSRRQ
jgi:hypothetical protein